MNNRKKNKRKNKKQTKISKILNFSRKTDAVRAAYLIKQSNVEIINNVRKVARNHHFLEITQLTLTGNLTRTYSPRVPYVDLPCYLSWMTGLIILHEQKINNFINLEEVLSKKILNDEFEKAIQILDEIDKTCGISTWSLSIRGTVYKLSDNHKESQKYTDTLNSKIGDNDFFKAIVKNMNDIYNDDSLMFESYNEATKNEILRTISGGLKHFLIYKIIPNNYVKEFKNDYEKIAVFEANSSLIDIFIFIRNFLEFCVEEKRTDQEEIIILILKKLRKHIHYYLFDNFYSYFTGKIYWKENNTEYEILDNYSKGKYENVIEQAKNYKKDDFSTFEIISKSKFRTNKNPYNGIKQKISDNLINIYSKGPEFNKSLSSIKAICHALSGLNWFRELSFFISRESSFIKNSKFENLISLNCIYSKSNYPRKAQILPDTEKNNYLDNCEKLNKNSISIELYRAIFSNDTTLFNNHLAKNIDPERANKFKAKILISNGNFPEGIEILKKLTNSKDAIVANECVYLLAKTYIDIGQPETAIKIFAEKTLENTNNIHLFDTKTICNESKILINTSSSIFIPISLSLHSRFIGPDFDPALRYSFEKYLSNVGATYPLDLTKHLSDIGEKNVHYYLEHVCTPDIMKLSFIFDNKEEIDKYRITICNYLSENNISKDNLVNEAKELTKEQVIRKATNQVDQSRIYADLSGFKDETQLFRKVYERYLKLSETDYSRHSDEISLASIHKGLQQQSLLEAASAIHVLDMSYNEKNTTFHKLIKMLRDEFTYGEKGLNRYLSTRIRHGVLSGKIRPCASNESLVTSVDPTNNKAKPNTYWKGHLPDLPAAEWKKIETSLSDFTLNFDNIINEINDKWLQIVSLDQDLKTLQKGEAKELALFNYTISMLETYSLQQQLSDKNYNNFIRIVSNWLWKRTEANLQEIKLKLTSEANNRFNQCYNDLHEKVAQSVKNQNSIVPLINAISRSKEQLQQTLSAILQWFTVNKADSVIKFDINTAVEIPSRLLNITPELDIDKDIDIKGKHLNSFVDIFYILFENACSKSNLQKNDLKIKVKLKCIGKKSLSLTVNNNCKCNENVEKCNKELESYTKTYDDEDIINIIAQKEGGTGIFKIRKILSRDLETNYKFDFGYVDNNLFKTYINFIDLSNILHHENTNC